MTFEELKDTKFYLEKYRRFVQDKLEELPYCEVKYVKSIRIMNQLTDEIRDEIITRIKKDEGCK